MRIFSKFHDYYDVARGYGIDPLIIYKRDTIKDKHCPDYDIPIIQSFFEKDFEDKQYKNFKIGGAFIVLFCGDVIPGIKLWLRGKVFDEELDIFPDVPVHIYSIEQMDAFFEKNATKDGYQAYITGKKDSKLTNYYWTRIKIQNLRIAAIEFFNQTLKTDKRIIDIHFKTGSPVIHIDAAPYPRRYEIEVAIRNPCLKELEFFKIFDPYTCFQELSMFISGVMGGTAPPMVEISNDMRIAKHGFDKWSFRKKVR